jgi:hypothetical protein
VSLIKKIEDRLRRKEQEIQELEIKISEAKAYIQALTDTIKLLPKDKKEFVSVEDKLRPGSLVFKTWEFLKKSGKPMHINEILIAIGKTTNKKDKIALAGSLGWYVRRQEIFTRPEPNTFGLIAIEKSEEPPDDFGVAEKEDEDIETTHVHHIRKRA